MRMCATAPIAREDIEDDRKSVYGFITAGMSLVALSAIIRLPQTEKPLGKDFVEKLHTVLSIIFAGLIFVGAFWACVNTNYFGDHSGVNGFCQYTCGSAVGKQTDGTSSPPCRTHSFRSSCRFRCPWHGARSGQRKSLSLANMTV